MANAQTGVPPGQTAGIDMRSQAATSHGGQWSEKSIKGLNATQSLVHSNDYGSPDPASRHVVAIEEESWEPDQQVNWPFISWFITVTSIVALLFGYGLAY